MALGSHPAGAGRSGVHYGGGDVWGALRVPWKLTLDAQPESVKCRFASTGGCSSVVERHLAKVDVEGSSPFTRSIYRNQHTKRPKGRFFVGDGPVWGWRRLFGRPLGMLVRLRSPTSKQNEHPGMVIFREAFR